MRISDDKIAEVRSCTDIVDVVSDFVRLKKRGSNFVGLCPFHNEKTPSFNVNPKLQIFKCFGCGVGGDVFQFLIRAENVSFPEAVRSLADRAGVHIPDDQPESREDDPTEAVYHALRFAARFFYDALTSDNDGAAALSYLTEKRKLNPGSIKKFGLGYAPAGWTTFADAANSAGIKKEVLEQAGLVLNRKDGSVYDRFRNRVMFPILSNVGRVVGFGGRVLDPGDEPKYINSPETVVYHKSRELYGLYQSKQGIRRKDEALLVEGYTDVISLSQAGVDTAVASSGTALTQDQVRALKRYCNRVVLLYDADSAGAGATVRGIDLILEAGMSVAVVRLPTGDDPDSFVQREGASGFEEYVRNKREDFVEFKYKVAVDDADLNTPESEAAGQRSVLESLSRIPDPLVRENYVRRASDVMGIPDLTIYEVLDGIRKQRRPGRPRRRPSEERADQDLEIGDRSDSVLSRSPLPEEKTLLRLMLEYGAPIVEFVLSNMSLEEFTEGPSRTVAAALLEMYQSGVVDKRKLLDGSLGDVARNLSAEVLLDVHEPSSNWQKKNIQVPRIHDDPRESATSAMTLLKLDRVDAAIANEKMLLRRTSGDREHVRTVQSRIIELQQMRKEIESRRYLSSADLSD